MLIGESRWLCLPEFCFLFLLVVCRASSEGVTKPARFLLEVKNEKFDYKPVVFKNGKVVPEKKTNSYSDPTTLKGKQKDIGASLDNPIGIPEEEVVLLEEQRKDIAFTISRYAKWRYTSLCGNIFYC